MPFALLTRRLSTSAGMRSRSTIEPARRGLLSLRDPAGASHAIGAPDHCRLKIDRIDIQDIGTTHGNKAVVIMDGAFRCPLSLGLASCRRRRSKG